MHRFLARLLPVFLLPAPLLAAEPVVLEGQVPDDDSDFLLLPFTVPEGTAELEFAHDDLSEENILDWGLDDPQGFRGWGGGNSENALLTEQAASRSYLRGPLPAGPWQVVVGKAKINDAPAQYRITLTFREQPTLPAQPERRAYVDAAPLETTARWYAGDFHVHSRESGDARPPLDEIADFARGRGLDFVEISDHNTVSHLEFLPDAQSRHPRLLLMPGVEFTTYGGHANGIGATQWVSHRMGLPGVDAEGAARAFQDQGAVFSINHPELDLGDACIGCVWQHQVPGELIGAVEIATGGWRQAGFLFTQKAIDFWEFLCGQGFHVTAIGGSDDHRAGVDLGAFGSPIGDPTTMVFANELSTPAIVAAVKAGRTVVKLQGPEDPMVDLRAGTAMVGDSIAVSSTTLKATVTDGVGAQLILVHNGVPQDPVTIDANPFTHERLVQSPASGEDRWRAEVHVDGNPRTVTSHLYLRHGEIPNEGRDTLFCHCTHVGGGTGVGMLVLLVGVFRGRRSSRRV
ncbi:MAG: CehA/McbA family metallohydrolase [Myxococcota bacterium]